MLKKITVKYSPGLGKFFPESFPARVTITTEDGKTFAKEVRYPKGDPENPLSWEEVLQKFNWSVVGSTLSKDKKERIIQGVWNFEKVENVRDFTALLG